MAPRDLSAMTVSELTNLAKVVGISGYSGLRKADLVGLIQSHLTRELESRIVPKPESKPKPKPESKPKPRSKYKSKPRSKSRPKRKLVDLQVEEAVRTIRNAFCDGKSGIDVTLFNSEQVAEVRRRLGRKAKIARFALNTRRAAIG